MISCSAAIGGIGVAVIGAYDDVDQQSYDLVRRCTILAATGGVGVFRRGVSSEGRVISAYCFLGGIMYLSLAYAFSNSDHHTGFISGVRDGLKDSVSYIGLESRQITAFD
ncbi:hypothetical protein [Endozoicomonas sp.]|uniref:hypothetical protein n=1 Tax=Endozoicomonas sp. TaxID=1892382 RepID=UPI002887AACE|nr:hypothetical protein [Endozoicomonas sp.]